MSIYTQRSLRYGKAHFSFAISKILINRDASRNRGLIKITVIDIWNLLAFEILRLYCVGVSKEKVADPFQRRANRK